jgi:hypothetical protein
MRGRLALLVVACLATASCQPAASPVTDSLDLGTSRADIVRMQDGSRCLIVENSARTAIATHCQWRPLPPR